MAILNIVIDIFSLIGKNQKEIIAVFTGISAIIKMAQKA